MSEVVKLSYQEMFVIALRYAGIAMIINISFSLYTDNETGFFADFLNIMSFSVIYGICLFYTVEKVVQAQNLNVLISSVIITGIMYLLISGAIQSAFVAFIKDVDIEQMRELATKIWKQNKIPEEKISVMVELINREFVFIATFIAHFLLGIVSLIITHFILKMRVTRDKANKK